VIDQRWNVARVFVQSRAYRVRVARPRQVEAMAAHESSISSPETQGQRPTQSCGDSTQHSRRLALYFLVESDTRKTLNSRPIGVA